MTATESAGDVYEFRFQVGDRVTRTENVFFPNETEGRPVLLRGRIVCRYAEMEFGVGRRSSSSYYELYRVVWDDRGIAHAYFAHGLERET